MVLSGVEPGGASSQQLQEVVFGLNAGSSPAAPDALNKQLSGLSTALVKVGSRQGEITSSSEAHLTAST